MRKVLSLIVSILFLSQMYLFANDANASSTTYTWGEVKQTTYNDFHPYTFVWSGDPLDVPNIKGFNFSMMKMTTNKDEIDLVMNQYGSMAANGVIVLNEDLDDSTDVNEYTGFQTTAQMNVDQVYLIARSDGGYVKVRIDQILPTKVKFSYTLATETTIEDDIKEEEQNSNTTPDYNDEPKDVFYEMEEGAVVVSVQEDPSDAYYEVYRSDNGGKFIKLTDLPIYQSYFEDKYAFAGHTYVYYFDIFDANDNLIASSVNITVDVVKPKVTIPTPTPKPKPIEPEKPQSLIQLQINNKNATVNGVKKTLDVPPTIVDGRTLVPVRFISEALGADVQWNGNDRSITIKYNGKSILLWLNKSEAKINGKTVFLDVPAQMLNSRTMVPLRFISENLDQDITFDKDTFEVEIKGKGLVIDTNNQSEEQSEDQSFDHIFGNWDLWVPGGVNVVNGYYEYTPGAGGDTLTIKQDGTYKWVVVNGKVINGKWTKNGNGVTLVKGRYEWDWNVFETEVNGGKGIRVSTFGVYYEGTPSK